MPIDYQKKEAKQSLWDHDGQHIPKRYRNKGKGRLKDKREILQELQELASGDDRERQIEWEKELERATDCHYFEPCEACLEHEQEESR